MFNPISKIISVTATQSTPEQVGRDEGLRALRALQRRCKQNTTTHAGLQTKRSVENDHEDPERSERRQARDKDEEPKPARREGSEGRGAQGMEEPALHSTLQRSVTEAHWRAVRDAVLGLGEGGR